MLRSFCEMIPSFFCLAQLLVYVRSISWGLTSAVPCFSSDFVFVHAPPDRRLVDVLRLCAMLLSQNQCTRLLSMPGLVQIAAESQTGSMAVAQAGARSCHLTRSRASR